MHTTLNFVMPRWMEISINKTASN